MTLGLLVMAVLTASCSSSATGGEDGSDTSTSVTLPGAGRQVRPEEAEPALWVIDGDTDEVLRISPDTGEVTARVPFGTALTDIAAARSGVWAVTAVDRKLMRIDLSTNEPRTVLTVGDEAVRRVAAAGDEVWLGSGGTDGKVARVDPARGRIVAAVPTGARLDDIAVGAGAVWVAHKDPARLVRVDIASERVVATVALPTPPASIAVGDGAVWACGDGALHRIDPVTNTVVTTIPVGGPGSAIATGEGGVWASDPVAATVTFVDPATNSPGAPVTGIAGAAEIAVGGGAVWVTSDLATSLYAVNPNSRQVVPLPLDDVLRRPVYG